jgi:hypothetical protein
MRSNCKKGLPVIAVCCLGSLGVVLPGCAEATPQDPTPATTSAPAAPTEAKPTKHEEAKRAREAAKARLVRCRLHPQTCVQSQDAGHKDNETVPR